MSDQELTSTRYFNDNTTPEADTASVELQAGSTRGADVIKTINILLLFAVIAGFSGGAYWLYQNQDSIPRMKKSGSKDMRMSILSWIVGRDVTEPPDGPWGQSYDADEFMEQLERQNEEMMERFEEQQRQIHESIRSQQRYSDFGD